MMRVLWLVLLLSGCGQSIPTSLLLTIDAPGIEQIDAMQLFVYDAGGRVVSQRLPVVGVPALPGTVVLYPPRAGEMELSTKTGATQWIKRWGGSGDDHARGLTAHGDRLVVVGSFEDEVTLGSAGMLQSKGGQDAAIIWSTSDGEIEDARKLGDSGDEQLLAAASRDAVLYLAGQFSSSSLTVANHNLSNQGGTDIFVAAMESRTAVAGLALGGTGDDKPTRLALDSGGTLHLLASYSSTLTIKGQPVLSAGGLDSIWVELALTRY